jgi:hypothetical protein
MRQISLALLVLNANPARSVIQHRVNIIWQKFGSLLNFRLITFASSGCLMESCKEFVATLWG